MSAVFNDGYAALSYIFEHNIGLIFLDINLPGMSGLEMAQRLSVLRKPPLIIFMTAFQEHALEAFDTPAVGFITKPVTEVNLAKALNKIRALTENVGPQRSVPPNKICVINNGKFVPVDKQDIVLVYVKNKDVFVRTVWRIHFHIDLARSGNHPCRQQIFTCSSAIYRKSG